MAGEIERAAKRFEERKTAAGVPNDGVLTDPEAQWRPSMAGLDLDYAEIVRMLPLVSMAAVPGLMSSLPVPHVAACMWFEGIAVGLLIAEERQKAGAS